MGERFTSGADVALQATDSASAASGSQILARESLPQMMDRT
jgi:hypothetical protein